MKSLICVLFLASLLGNVKSQYVENQTNYHTRFELRQSFNSSDYVYNIDNSNPGAVGLGGKIFSVSLGNLHSLSGEGISYALYTLEPCGISNPHSHPRATELIYIVEGSYIDVGFLEEDGGRVINNRISKGQTTIFPQGLIHYIQNNGCEPSKILVALNSEDPGVISVSPQSLSFPDIAVATSYGLTINQINTLKSRLPKIPSPGYGNCRLRCNITNSINGSNLYKWQAFKYMQLCGVLIAILLKRVF